TLTASNRNRAFIFRSLLYRAIRFSQLVRSEHLLNLLWRVWLQKSQRKQDSRLLRIQFIGRDEPELVVFHLDVTADCSGWDATAAYHDNAFLHCGGCSIDGCFVHVAVTHACDHDSFGAI